MQATYSYIGRCPPSAWATADHACSSVRHVAWSLHGFVIRPVCGIFDIWARVDSQLCHRGLEEWNFGMLQQKLESTIRFDLSIHVSCVRTRQKSMSLVPMWCPLVLASVPFWTVSRTCSKLFFASENFLSEPGAFCSWPLPSLCHSLARQLCKTQPYS